MELSEYLGLFDRFGCPKKRLEIVIQESSDYEKSIWKSIQTDKKQAELETVIMEALQGKEV